MRLSARHNLALPWAQGGAAQGLGLRFRPHLLLVAQGHLLNSVLAPPGTFFENRGLSQWLTEIRDV